MPPLVLDLAAYAGHAPLLARFTALTMALPLTGDAFTNMRWRLGLALMLTVLFAGLSPAAPIDAIGRASVAAAGEGLLIGLVGRAVIIAMQMTSAVIAASVGLQMASQMNPVEGQQSNVIDVLFVFIGLVLLLDLGFLHMLLALPPGSAGSGGPALQDAIRISGRAIVLGILLAAPIGIFALAANLAAGIANRFLPAYPVSMLVVPIQILAGLLLAAAMLESPLLRATIREFLATFGT